MSRRNPFLKMGYDKRQARRLRRYYGKRNQVRSGTKCPGFGGCANEVGGMHERVFHAEQWPKCPEGVHPPISSYGSTRWLS